jgi:hypothetical protein
MDRDTIIHDESQGGAVGSNQFLDASQDGDPVAEATGQEPEPPA